MLLTYLLTYFHWLIMLRLIFLVTAFFYVQKSLSLLLEIYWGVLPFQEPTYFHNCLAYRSCWQWKMMWRMRRWKMRWLRSTKLYRVISCCCRINLQSVMLRWRRSRVAAASRSSLESKHRSVRVCFVLLTQVLWWNLSSSSWRIDGCGPLWRLSTMSTFLCILSRLSPAGCCSITNLLYPCLSFLGRPGGLRQFIAEQRSAFIAMTCFRAWCAGTLALRGR